MFLIFEINFFDFLFLFRLSHENCSDEDVEIVSI